MSRHPGNATPPNSGADKPLKPVTVNTFNQMKRRGEPIACLTAYDYSMARILDQAGTEMILVGDSLAMTMLGHPNTLSITVDEMLHHVKAVTRGCKRSFVIADMPFMSYQVDHHSAIANAGRFIQEGHANAVKLEGATGPILSVINHLTHIGIPVMGHLGLTPQSINTLGGFKLQGKGLEAAQKMLDEAKQLQAAGAFAVVLEMVPVEVAQWISEQLTIPTIGIGAGNGCDGQVLVIDDILGRYADLSPKFVRQYLDSQTLMTEAVQRYMADVRARTFPNNETEAYHLPEGVSLPNPNAEPTFCPL